MRIVQVFAALLLAGCTQSVDTGVLQAGPNTFTLTEPVTPIVGGANEAMHSALTKATDFCSDNGRVFVPSSTGRTAGPAATYTVTFQCVPSKEMAVAN
jgi:hypothetical protein